MVTKVWGIGKRAWRIGGGGYNCLIRWCEWYMEWRYRVGKKERKEMKGIHKKFIKWTMDTRHGWRRIREKNSDSEGGEEDMEI